MEFTQPLQGVRLITSLAFGLGHTVREDTQRRLDFPLEALGDDRWRLLSSDLKSSRLLLPRLG